MRRRGQIDDSQRQRRDERKRYWHEVCRIVPINVGGRGASGGAGSNHGGGSCAKTFSAVKSRANAVIEKQIDWRMLVESEVNCLPGGLASPADSKTPRYFANLPRGDSIRGGTFTSPRIPRTRMYGAVA